jgi:hypothetical protein
VRRYPVHGRLAGGRVAVGVPFNRFLPLVQGLWETLNPTEPDRNKKQIQTRLEKSEVNNLESSSEKIIIPACTEHALPRKETRP